MITIIITAKRNVEINHLYETLRKIVIVIILTTVSYTHLDVYKRQEESKVKIKQAYLIDRNV